MKLSEVRGTRVFDVMAELVEPIADIASSDVLKDMLRPMECPEGVEPRKFMAERVKSAVPSLIEAHSNDLIKVLSTIGNVSPEEYVEKMTFISLWSDVMELMGDDDFLNFLGSVRVMMEGLHSTSE